MILIIDKSCAMTGPYGFCHGALAHILCHEIIREKANITCRGAFGGYGIDVILGFPLARVRANRKDRGGHR